jgi:hypothetical protein
MGMIDGKVIEKLRQENREFRILESRHQQLEEELEQLLRHHLLTPQEEFRKKELQKQKLAAKDRMADLIRHYERALASDGHRRVSPPSAPSPSGGGVA